MKWAQRWSVNEDGEMVMDDDGSWVENAYYEYLKAENARLKAEVERLRAASFVTAVPVEQYERLIKAGDAMDRQARYTWLRSLQTDTQKRKDWLKNLHQSLIDWKVAKGCEPTKDGEDCDL